MQAYFVTTHSVHYQSIPVRGKVTVRRKTIIPPQSLNISQKLHLWILLYWDTNLNVSFGVDNLYANHINNAKKYLF
jgi:hypothetical protein